MPGIICYGTGIIWEQIDFQDWTKMLTMSDIETNVDVGRWVRVCRGRYKGDVGYVLASEPWGVCLLLVPRLSLPNLATSSLKRKRSAVAPDPALFDLKTIEHVYGTPAIKQDDGTYRFRGNIFTDGLLIKKLDFLLISLTSVFMPTSMFFLFQQSNHPAILSARFPCPLEWIFNKGDWVLICSSSKLGVVASVRAEMVEVDLTSGEGLISITWTELHKHVIVGDFVEVLSRPLQNLTGWVEAVDGETVNVIQHIGSEMLEENQRHCIKVSCTLQSPIFGYL